MTVIKCEERCEDASGTLTRKGAKLTRTYERAYLVTCDSKEDCEVDIWNSELTPGFGASFAKDVAAVLKTFNVSRNPDPIEPDNGTSNEAWWQWVLKASWTTDKDDANDKPTYPDTPAKISYSWDKKEVPLVYDRENVPVLNTAKDPYDPPVMIEFPIPVKTITVNLPASMYSASWQNQYFMAINSEAYDGWGEKQVMVQDITAAQEYYTDDNDNDVMYWVVTIKLAFNALGWQPRILSTGYRELVDDTSEGAEEGAKKKIVITIEGKEASRPVPLDEDGKKLLGADVAENAHFDDYKAYNEVPFNDFNF